MYFFMYLSRVCDAVSQLVLFITLNLKCNNLSGWLFERYNDA